MWKRFRLFRCTQQNGERANSRWSGFAARLYGFIHSENFEVETGEMAASSNIWGAQNCHQGFPWLTVSHGSRHPVHTVGAALARHHLSIDTAEKQRQWNVLLLQLQTAISRSNLSGVYFVKRLPIEVPRDDCGAWLISGDLATRSIDQLSCLVDEIFVPLLSNTDNHKGWPEMWVDRIFKRTSWVTMFFFFRVAQDVLKHVSQSRFAIKVN